MLFDSLLYHRKGSNTTRVKRKRPGPTSGRKLRKISIKSITRDSIRPVHVMTAVRCPAVRWGLAQYEDTKSRYINKFYSGNRILKYKRIQMERLLIKEFSFRDIHTPGQYHRTIRIRATIGDTPKCSIRI